MQWPFKRNTLIIPHYFFATKLAASSLKKNAHAKEATAYLLTYWDIAVWLQSSQLL